MGACKPQYNNGTPPRNYTQAHFIEKHSPTVRPCPEACKPSLFSPSTNIVTVSPYIIREKCAIPLSYGT